MFLLKKVGNRVKGMGFKVMKFHAIIHLAFDILMFGVPMNVDTGSNESHHKTTKVVAKLTQKDIKTFEKQTSNRCDDFHVLDLAMEEIAGRPLWEYYAGFDHQVIAEKEEVQTTGGMKMIVSLAENGMKVANVVTRMKGKENLLIDNHFIQFVYDLQEDLAHVLTTPLHICAEHSRGGQIFRSHPNFMGKGVWRDWVMIAWSTGDLPARLWGFVDLSSIPQGQSTLLRDTTTSVEQGVYAIIESCDYVPPEEHPDAVSSDIFTEIQLETSLNNADGEVLQRKFYLVDVETFKAPLVVIPNIGATPKCRYLMMTPRSEWSEDFIAWVEMDHNIDNWEMQPTDAEEEPDSEPEPDEEDVSA
jgi:hypothetical protein